MPADSEHNLLQAAVDEIQTHGTRQALLQLFAHRLYQQSSLQNVLALTLEQAVENLHALGGSVWMTEESGEIYLKFSFFDVEAEEITRATVYQLAQQTAQSKAMQKILSDGQKCTSIGIPIVYNEQILGVLVLHARKDGYFTETECGLLKEFTSLSAPVIRSFFIQERLQKQTEQRNALLEMSYQIANGLDVDETLQRSLHWAHRLCPMELGWVGTYDEQEQTIRSIHALGISLGDSTFAMQVSECSHFQNAIHNKRPVLTLPETSDLLPSYCLQRSKNIRQAGIFPLTYQQEVLGVLVLANKFDGEFSQEDVENLTILSRITATALNNARLHAHSVALLSERDRLQKIVIQQERLAIVGRMMRSLAHEINNPLQSVRGALTLAREDINDPDDLRVYLDIIDRETRRVIQLLQRMRYIYRDSGEPQVIDINQLVQNLAAISQKELHWQRIHLEIALNPQPPLVWGHSGQLHVALLNFLLIISAGIAKEAQSSLMLQTRIYNQYAWIIMHTSASLTWLENLLDAQLPEDISESGFGLHFSRELIKAHNGRINVQGKGARHALLVALPLQTSDKK